MIQSDGETEFPLAPAAVHAEVADIIVRAGFYNDRARYDLLAAFLAPEVIVDAVSLFGGTVETVPRDELIGRYKSRLPGCDFNQHMISCAEVRLENADRTIAQSYFRATHRVDNRLWVVGGLYTHHLVRLEGGWRIAYIKIDLGYEEGDRAILDIAAERVAQRSAG